MLKSMSSLFCACMSLRALMAFMICVCFYPPKQACVQCHVVDYAECAIILCTCMCGAYMAM